MNRALTNRRKPAKIEWVLSKALVITLASVAIVVGFIFFRDALHSFFNAVSAMDVWLIIAVTTFMVMTGMVMLGRYCERKQEIEANIRSQKIDVYDDFLKELTKIFHREHSRDDLVVFLTMWQSKLILWSGGEMLYAFVRWHESLITEAGDTQSLMLLDDLIRTLREEIGHSSTELERGAFIHLMINHGAFLREHSSAAQDAAPHQ